MRKLFASSFIFVLVFATEAVGQIRVDKARIDDGWLVVRGKVSSRAQLVTMDRKFRTNSKRGGKFDFRVRHTPFVCRIELRSGGVQETVKVENCVMDDMRESKPR
jgi:hypothetical protein